MLESLKRTATGVEARGWRELLAHWLQWAMIPLTALGIPALWFGLETRSMRVPMVLALLAVLAGLLFGALQPALALRARARILALACFATASVGCVLGAYLGNQTLVFALGILVTGLLLGRRALLVHVAGASLVLALVGWGMSAGWLPQPPLVDISPLHAHAWLRVWFVACLVWTFLGLLVLQVVGHIEGALAQSQAEQLRRAQALEASMRAEKRELVGRLAAALAHDINNSLQVIEIANELAHDARATAEQRQESRQVVSEAAAQAARLVRYLLTLGRKDVHAPRRVRLAESLARAERLGRSLLPSNIALTSELRGDANLWVDEGQLVHALLNLIVNARDALPEGGHIRLAAQPHEFAQPRAVGSRSLSAGAWVALSVIDDGTGMDAATLALACEPFFTTKAAGQGTGLGLASVQAFAQQSGGQLELHSQLGQGSCVTLWLPRVQAAEPQPARPASDQPAAGRTVLLLDDDASVRQLLETVLTEAGCRVLSADRGARALEWLEQHPGPIDLLCTDAVVPGFAVAELLERFEARHPGAPVLICSGFVGEELARRGIETGRYRLLSKPFTPDELVRAVHELIGAPAPA